MINSGAFNRCYSLEKVLLPTTLSNIVDVPTFRVFPYNLDFTMYCNYGTYGFNLTGKKSPASIGGGVNCPSAVG